MILHPELVELTMCIYRKSPDGEPSGLFMTLSNKGDCRKAESKFKRCDV